jgi:hypothetical protein
MTAVMPRLTHVFIHDSDLRERETLVYGFEGDGIKAVSATETDDLAAAVVSQSPQVVIVAVRSDDPAALAPAKALAESDRTRDIPRLVLTSSREAAQQLRSAGGPISFLPLPAFVRDVITAAKLLVGGAATSSPPAPDEKGGSAQGELSGALSEYGLYFIVRTMVGLGRSGIVQVERGGRKGEIRFSEGEVVSAQVGPLQGKAALHQLLLWEEATLEIKFRPVVRLGQSLPSGEELLEDCERFLRDFAHATKNIGHAQSLFVQDAERVARLLESIPPEVVPVMRLFDGQRSLGDVLEDSPFRVFDTLRTITRLLDMGIIRRKAIERPTTGLPGLRRPRPDEWIRPSEAAKSSAPPTLPTAPVEPPPAHPPAASAAEPEKVGLFTRRRAPRRRTGEVPAPPVQPAPPPARPEAPPPASVEIVVPPRTGISSSVHGELRVPSRHQPVRTALADVPKVVIDFGAVEDPALEEPAAPRASAPVRAAEITTSGRAPVGSAPPAEGPSIMIDPRLVAEMDALEGAATPPTAAPPGPRPPAAPAPPPIGAAVVSFVHPNPGPAAPPVSSTAPTIPVAGRRASSEFDSVEKDFFAREPEAEDEVGSSDDSDANGKADLDPDPGEPQ